MNEGPRRIALGVDQGHYSPTRNLNGVRAPLYERADLRINKDYVHQQFNATLYAEIIHVTNHGNRDFDSAGPYNPATAATAPNFDSMFPILPSLGAVFAF